MFLSNHNFIGGARGTVFGDGTYSQNITVPNPDDKITAGAYVSVTGTHTMVDRGIVLTAGKRVTHLGVYSDGVAVTMQAVILRRNATGNYTSMYKQQISVAAAVGWQWFELTTPYTIPSDSYTYHPGMYCASANVGYASGVARSYAAADYAQGATFALTEDTSNGYMVGAKYDRVVLQPQASYTLPSGVVVPNAVVITGAATIIPDPTTLCAFACGQSLVLNGATASLKPSTFCKGMFLIFKRIDYINGAGASMTSFGYPGEVTVDPNLYDLIPATLNKKFKKTFWSAQTLSKTGAAGAAARVGAGAGIAGSSGTGRQTGGGGSGGVGNSGTSGKGGAGTAFSGGSGGGSTVNGGACGNADEFGGAGGYATYGNSTAGAGRPAGTGGQGCTAVGAGGVMFIAAEDGPYIGSGSVLQADGIQNTPPSNHTSGGSTGGGGIIIFHAGSYINQGTIRANGGIAGASGSGVPGGPGGAGYIEIVQVV